MRKILGFLQSPGFRAGFLIVAIVAAIYAVASNWGEVSEALRALPAWLVAVEVLLSFGYVYLTMASWRLVLNDVGTPVNATVASRIFFSSQVAKYLPGGVWNFVAAAEVGRDYEISRRRSVCALLVSIVISIVTGMILAILAVVLGPDNVRENYGWLIAVLPLALIALCPPILNRLVNFALKVLGREPLEGCDDVEENVARGAMGSRCLVRGGAPAVAHARATGNAGNRAHLPSRYRRLCTRVDRGIPCLLCPRWGRSSRGGTWCGVVNGGSSGRRRRRCSSCSYLHDGGRYRMGSRSVAGNAPRLRK